MLTVEIRDLDNVCTPGLFYLKDEIGVFFKERNCGWFHVEDRAHDGVSDKTTFIFYIDDDMVALEFKLKYS